MDVMRVERSILTLSLILIVLISGCVDQGEKEEPKDEALKLEVRIKEKDERRRILPDQTIKMLVYLKSQVEDEVENVSLKISNPYGLKIKKVDCWFNCTCEGTTKSSDCGKDKGVDCITPNYNGCWYGSIQGFDEIEISFFLKVPSEDEIPYPWTDLKPEITLEYDYGGESTLYIPILAYEERMRDVTSEFTYTKQPIHVDIKSEDWVREGDVFPVYFEVKDVVTTRTPESRFTIPNKTFEVYFPTEYLEVIECNPEFQKTGCSLVAGSSCYHPKGDIQLPLENPLICTLEAKTVPSPMVKAPIIASYSYSYGVKRTETIRVEKALLKIF